MSKQGSPMIPNLGNATKPTWISNPLLTQKAPPLKALKDIGTSLTKWKINHLKVNPQHWNTP